MLLQQQQLGLERNDVGTFGRDRYKLMMSGEPVFSLSFISFGKRRSAFCGMQNASVRGDLRVLSCRSPVSSRCSQSVLLAESFGH